MSSRILNFLTKLGVFGTLAASPFLALRLNAQMPSLAPDDLRYTRAALVRNHLIARVTLQVGETKYVHYRYDQYSDLKRIVTADGVAYAKPQAKAWRKSNDWGETGTPVTQAKADELDRDIEIVELSFAKAQPQDPSQGDTVWRFIGVKKGKDYQLFTYERSRERPHPDGVYPRFTFIKYKGDKDGNLLLKHFSAQLFDGPKLIPVEIEYGLMIPLPPGTVIKIAR